MKEVDVLVIGSGIAGLSYALKVADRQPDKKILVAAKAGVLDTNTSFAQGGIAAVLDLATDSYQKHIEDTMEAGAWLCDPAVVELVVKEAPDRITDLVAWGVSFDLNAGGDFHLCKEGGHSENRILHVKDQTGVSLEKALSQQLKQRTNIEVLTHHFAIDLIIDEAKDGGTTCRGALLLNVKAQELVRVTARVTLLATGGAGQVYHATTNPVIATGDGVAMASRAGAAIEHMEFVQFHPTALFNPGHKPSFLVSEAVRGYGGILRNSAGRAFMEDYDPRGSLACRDVVARAIEAEMKKEAAHSMFLDVTHLDPDAFQAHFPTITQRCKSLGIDPATDLVPVVPAAHYFCGGVKVDTQARTSIENLYACGECASTGLHGANRLASNSLLEALVFAHRACEDTCGKLTNIDLVDVVPAWFAIPVRPPENPAQLDWLREEVQTLMSSNAGIFRSRKELFELRGRLKQLADEVEMMVGLSPLSLQLCELDNLLTVALLVVEAAINRKESIGLHYLAPDLESTPQPAALAEVEPT
ncbi:L-aspartate oxidase [Rufibacter radiotolerans]|uniref:L-aspartate oxidase n=1 Tax=Rufibacter radiotolerans TaxID=1379910 RepID=UPI00066460E1|nr:L-aspartate oxidase [Rufibacter radiotolerans]